MVNTYIGIPANHPCFLSVPEVGDMLCISRSGAYALVHTPGFPLTKLGKRLIVNRDDLMEWLKTQNPNV